VPRSGRLLAALALLAVAGVAAVGVAPGAAASDWRPGPSPLMTRWAADVSPEAPHPDYPRPQLRRDAWANLNGLWEYAIRPDGPAPAAFDGSILVPFPVESALSGVMRPVPEDHVLWYRRSFTVPAEWAGRRLLLHFGAVDWEATVWVDGVSVGSHRGGYDPFSFDISDALSERAEHELLVRVHDPTDRGSQPRGKQVDEPHGIWYTAVTGIWQTVWLEPVPSPHIERLRLEPDAIAGTLLLTALSQASPHSHAVRAVAYADGTQVAEAVGAPGAPLELAFARPRSWSPDDPFLFELRVELLAGDETVDAVRSYAGLRSIALGEDAGGVTRVLLNGEPLFQYGTLDQGYWPDGLYTAPTDEALRFDIEVARDLGFNMIRKHVKVEPARWYYWADRLGVLVWQDMPNGGPHVPYGGGEATGFVPWADQFELELTRVVDALHHHPSIVTWVIFNEGWGQHHTQRLSELVEGRDPSRLVNAASGWNDLGVGAMLDLHWYTGPAAPEPESGRASVLGEFGGLGLPIVGHTLQPAGNWGYQTFADASALTDGYLELIERLWPLIADPGLAAAVYTQTTDVEIEVNGLLTYDRAVLKMDPERVRAANASLYRAPPRTVTLVATAERADQRWRWTTDEPDGGWTGPAFDDGAWAESHAGFGAGYVPASLVRTPWTAPALWLRATFELDGDPADLDRLRLRVHHAHDVDIFLNGQHIVTLPHATSEYVDVRRDEALRAALRPGENVLAARVTRRWGGQYIDIGLYALASESAR
jgi:hypothetical protein